MGVSGVEIADDDLAADIQARFRDLASELSDEEATSHLITEHGEILADSDSHDAHVFWLALADVQQSLGRLDDEVEQRALEILDKGDDLERWPDTLRDERRKVLDGLKRRLEGPPLKRKRLERPFVDQNEWQPGDIIAYRRESGQRILFRVLGSYSDDGTWTEKGETSPMIEILDWQGEELPPADTLAELAVRKDRSHKQFARAVLFRQSRRDKKSKRFEPTGLRLERSPSLGEKARRGFRGLLVGLGMAQRLEVPGTTCRALHVRSLDKDLAHYYGF